MYISLDGYAMNIIHTKILLMEICKYEKKKQKKKPSQYQYQSYSYIIQANVLVNFN